MKRIEKRDLYYWVIIGLLILMIILLVSSPGTFTGNVVLNSPSDSSSTTNTTVIFNCSDSTSNELVNMTLYGNWSGGWHANETLPLSGTSNSTTFTKTLPKGTYKWNCYACDNGSNCAFASNNYTFANYKTYYIANQSCNDSWSGNSTNPWCTFSYALNTISGGDTLLIKDGTYNQSIGQYYAGASYNSYSPPNGTSEKYTIIKAENDFQVIILNSSVYIGGAVNGGTADGSSYIQIEGLKLKHSTIDIRHSKYIKVLKTGIKNGVDPDDRYGQVININDGSSYILLEDVWVIGTMRYGIIVFESDHVVLRRVVTRFDGNTEREPKAGICFYGATDSITGTNYSVCQNCIVIDFNNGYLLGGGSNTPHSAKYIRRVGNIALNLPTNGFTISEDCDSQFNDVINSVAWDVTNGVYTRDGNQSATSLVNRYTCGMCSRALVYYDNACGEKLNTTIKNSIVINNTYSLTGADKIDYNLFYPFSLEPVGSTNSITSDPKMKYILRVEQDSPAFESGENGVSRGANIINKTGVSGTFWGEPGWNTTTNESLWPWSYQNVIYEMASEADDFEYPSTYWNGDPYEITNHVTRGFCAPNQTLTKYIWEYLGYPNPYKQAGEVDFIFTDLNVSVGTTTANITFTTNLLTNSTVEINGQTFNDTNYLKNNSIQITGLTAGTTYDYNISYLYNSSLQNKTIGLHFTTNSICGDGTCNNGETCSTCPTDCGSCSSSTSSSSSSSGGGSSTATTDVSNETPEEEITKEIGQAEKGQEIELKIEESNVVTKLKFIVNEDFSTSKININVLDERPDNVSRLRVVYKYFEIDKGDLEVGNATIYFRISRAWMDENKYQTSNILLTRFVDGKWKDLPTEYLNEDSDYYYYYEADTPGFSYFAIKIDLSLFEVVKNKISKISQGFVIFFAIFLLLVVLIALLIVYMKNKMRGY